MKKKKKPDNIVINIDVSRDEVLGVFGKDIHILALAYNVNENLDYSNDYLCILIIPENIYIKEWKKWIKGKKDYCERYDHYCGVMGYVTAENPEYIGVQKINQWNEEKEDMEIVEVSVYKADKFPDEPDFEHG